jgi:hypothetical protein
MGLHVHSLPLRRLGRVAATGDHRGHAAAAFGISTLLVEDCFEVDLTLVVWVLMLDMLYDAMMLMQWLGFDALSLTGYSTHDKLSNMNNSQQKRYSISVRILMRSPRLRLTRNQVVCQCSSRQLQGSQSIECTSANSSMYDGTLFFLFLFFSPFM